LFTRYKECVGVFFNCDCDCVCVFDGRSVVSAFIRDPGFAFNIATAFAITVCKDVYIYGVDGAVEGSGRPGGALAWGSLGRWLGAAV
jgi:hypothetical protein